MVHRMLKRPADFGWQHVQTLSFLLLWYCIVGMQGEIGYSGNPGSQGAQGEAGRDGAPGPAGPPGAKGNRVSLICHCLNLF